MNGPARLNLSILSLLALPAMRTIAVAIFSLLGMAAITPATSAELDVLSPTALRSSMQELIPQFEGSSGHKLKVGFGPAGALARRIQQGEVLDVGIVTDAQIDNLQKQGKIVAGSKTIIARVGVGVFVRKGAAKPDIRSVEAFKRALLAAKSIGHFDPAGGAPSGIFAARLLSSLGIGAELKQKIKVYPPGRSIYAAIAEGEIEIGLGQITEIVTQPTAQLVGPLPAEIQNYTLFAAGIATVSKTQDAAKSLIDFLTSAAAARVMKAKGLEKYVGGVR